MEGYEKNDNYISEILNAPKGFGGIDANDIKDLFSDDEEIFAIEASVEASLSNRMERLMEQIKKQTKGYKSFNHCLVFFFFPKDYPLMMEELLLFNEWIDSIPGLSMMKWGMSTTANNSQTSLREIVLLQQNYRTV